MRGPGNAEYTWPGNLRELSSVRGRDLASAVAKSQEAVTAKVKLPYGIHIDWSGEFNELKEATDRLLLIVPLTLVLIGFLVYRAVHNWLDTLIVLIDIPVACTGGILALLITGQHFSVSAAMGFVSIFGIAVQDALLRVTYFQRLHFDHGLPVEQARGVGEAVPPGADDHAGGDPGPAPGRPRARHRRGHAAAARHRGDRTRWPPGWCSTGGVDLDPVSE